MGTPERIAARLAEYVESGVTELCAIFYAPDDESTERQTRLLRRRSCRSWESPLPQRKLLALDARWHEKKEDPMNERATRSSLQGSQ